MANKVEIQIVGNNVYAINAIDGVKTKLGTLDKSAKSTNSIISKLGVTLAGAFSVYAIANYGSQLLDVGNKVRGVENAFKRIDQGNYLEALRIATNGLISDLELMQAATFAEKFKIPFNVLVKGMEFAQLTAIETGQSFEYMMDSFVRGTARESEKILDNLGISAKVLREEIKRTGDFMTALENIMDSELNKMRGSLDETILKARKFSTEMANAWDKIGVATSYAFNWLTEYGNKISIAYVIAEGLAKRQAELNKLVGQRFDLLATTFNLEKEALPQMVLLTETQKKALALAQKSREEEEKKLDTLRRQNQELRERIDYALFQSIMAEELDEEGMFEPWHNVGVSAVEQNEMARAAISDLTAFDRANWYLRSDIAQQTFGDMGQAMLNFYELSGKASKGAFIAFKGFAIAETLAATFAASMKILEAYAVVPWYAYAQAGAVIALGLTRAGQIAALQPGSSGGGGGGSMPSVPSNNNITNNNQRNPTYNIVINSQGGFGGDLDKFAREIIYHIDKARDDGG
jgi:ElaB/YqjD/DUF883 family membrane-anchored ribosome-binding protein